MSLRSGKKCPIFVNGQELPQNVLPTYEDVIRYYLLVTQNIQQRQDRVKITAETVATEIEKIWTRASIPFIEHRTIVARIKAYHDKYRFILKPYQKRKSNDNYLQKLQQFKTDSKKLFDIASCKCSCFISCLCEKRRKIPIQERDFMIDQRNERKMMIGSIDLVTTKRFERKLEREAKKTPCEKQELLTETGAIDIAKPRDGSSFSREINNESSLKPLLSVSEAPRNTSVPPVSYATVARTLDRYGISDRAGAALVSATLQDIGLITRESSDNIVDRSKIRRMRSKARETVMKQGFTDIPEYICISFDGRKDKTLVQEDSRRRVIVEEHITVLMEPGSKYLGHISLKSGKAKEIATSLCSFFAENSISLTNILAIGCDGTVVNTGNKAGIIKLIENQLQQPLQWLICQLHANELALRHLFDNLDGSTTGPKSFSGPIGKSLNNCELLPVKSFNAITCCLPDITKSRDDLSTDQLYLLEMCQAISKGECDERLAKRRPGKICHSRWLTTANSILRLYIATENPAKNLKILTEFVIKVYAPMWFRIKTHPSCIHGAKHLFDTIQLSRYLPDKLKKVIDPVIQRNGYFGHTENILIAMLADDRKHNRELALRRILKIRDSSTGRTPMRVFKVPKFNFEAQDFTELVAWDKPSEPPLTKIYPTDVILAALMDPEKNTSEILQVFQDIPCHTQGTERCIKLVTESCAAVCGQNRREGWIRNKIKSFQVMPSFNTKKEYKIE
ncbi:uncharacterized protein LOC133525257 [Cydia pomonella]|uniref:uncharacterized protein LOC133525257 n=1 Tax=Cydia pomonella TaxID=82600 RepID=UPI002ADDA2EE|nr:uncharacterized protein LOC133525257 [Cydia pomonella]XP_061717534.1 uncharacterized protein LOC133525257 [Cydia pomonella]